MSLYWVGLLLALFGVLMFHNSNLAVSLIGCFFFIAGVIATIDDFEKLEERLKTIEQKLEKLEKECG